MWSLWCEYAHHLQSHGFLLSAQDPPQESEIHFSFFVFKHINLFKKNFRFTPAFFVFMSLISSGLACFFFTWQLAKRRKTCSHQVILNLNTVMHWFFSPHFYQHGNKPNQRRMAANEKIHGSFCQIYWWNLRPHCQVRCIAKISPVSMCLYVSVCDAASMPTSETESVNTENHSGVDKSLCCGPLWWVSVLKASTGSMNVSF